jgi:fumarate hydratase class II
MHVSVALEINQSLIPSLKFLHKSLDEKSNLFEKIIKIGRTHMQDAVPLTLGQEFSAFAQQISYSIERIESTLPRLYKLAIGIQSGLILK